MEWKQILISIDENIENEMSVKDLANMAGYSEFYFLRKFRDFMGMTPMDYVQKRRLIKASKDSCWTENYRCSNSIWLAIT